MVSGTEKSTRKTPKAAYICHVSLKNQRARLDLPVTPPKYKNKSKESSALRSAPAVCCRLQQKQLTPKPLKTTISISKHKQKLFLLKYVLKHLKIEVWRDGSVVRTLVVYAKDPSSVSAPTP